MSSLRFHLWLTLTLLVSLLPLIQAKGAANLWQPTAVITVEEDESELRNVINEYFTALRNKDWQRLDAIESKRLAEVVINGSDSHGPLSPYNASLELTKRLLSPYIIETLNFTIDKLEIKGCEATVNARVSMRVREPDTGKKVIDFVNLERVLHLDKNQSLWKLNLDAADSASLKEQIKRASTSVERQFLFNQENLSQLDQASEGLKNEGNRLLEEERLDQSFILFGLAQEIDDHLRQRATIAAEMRSKQREAGIAQYRASGRHKDLALNLLWAGQDYAELKDYVKAKGYFIESIELLKQLGDRQELAKAYSELAAIYLEQGDYSQAIDSYQNSIDKYMLVAAEDEHDSGFTISDIDDAVVQVAYLYSAQGKYDLVEKFVLSNSEKFEKLGKTEEAMLLPYVLAILKMARGDNSQAAKDLENLLLRIDKVEPQIEDKDEAVAGIRLMLTLLYNQQNNFAIAAQHFEKMRPAKVKPDDDFAWSKVLQFMDGLVYGMQGNESLMASRFKKFMPALMQAGLEELGVHDALYVSCMGRLLPNAFEDELPQKEFGLALRCFQFGAVMAEKAGDKIHAARAHQFIASLYANKQNHSKELEHYRKGLSLLQNGLLPFKERYVGQVMIDNLLLNSGGAYSELENYEEALTTYRKILDRNNLRLFRLFEQVILLDIAEAYYALGKFNEATNYAAEAVRAAKRSGDGDTLRDAHVLAGHAYWTLNQIDLARKSYQEAINEVEAVHPQVAGSEQSAARFFEDQLTPYQSMVELLLSQGQTEDALSYSERSKSKVLLDIIKKDKKSTALSMTDLEQRQEYSLRRKLILLNRQVIQAQGEQTNDSEMRKLRNQRVEARLDYELFRTRLYVNYPELAEHPDYARKTIKTEEIGSLLTSQSEAILEFMVTEEKTYLFVLTKQNGRQRGEFGDSATQPDIDYRVYEIEIKKDKLESLVNNFRLRVSNPEGVVGHQAHELYKLLLGQARGQLADRELLIIVPDGILWNLPFQALKPTEDRYLLEESAIYYTSSLTALREMQRLRGKASLKSQSDATGAEGSSAPSLPRNPSLLVVGNPTICENKDCNRPPYQSNKFSPLPRSEQLAKKLYDLYGTKSSGLYSGKMADEATIKREAANYQVIHIGAHGVLDNDNPMYSFLVLSQAAKRVENTDVDGERIGIQDGFLEAWELMDLQLKAEMIVLSSCDTARGKVLKGEGIVGFSWAALMAGCPTVVVGQWQVDETSTSELMYDFHKRWREERIVNQTQVNVAAALQRSELALLRNKKYSHPYYWAGFTIIGVGH